VIVRREKTAKTDATHAEAKRPISEERSGANQPNLDAIGDRAIGAIGDRASFGGNVTDLQVANFLEPQAHRVGGPKEGRNPLDSAGVDNAVELFDGGNVRRRFVPLQFHRGERLPISRVGSRAKELDT
tara:strand:+ start:24988 stop:25371 length:384 start_codon:yes stop_codon:yes gene_type:complete